MANYSFPELPAAKIAQVLQEERIAVVSTNDLAKPSAELLFAIFSNVLVYIDPVRNDLDQMGFEALAVLEDPSQRAYAIRVLSLYKKMRAIFASIQYHDFTLRDLIHPSDDPERTLRHLSALSNFITFRREELDRLKLLDRKAKLTSRISELNEAIQGHEIKAKMEEPVVQQLDTEVREQIDRLSNLPVALLVTILSFLPTRIAARTSILCRCFRHLWEASSLLALISNDFPLLSRGRSEKFVAMVNHALLHRDPSHSILCLHINVWHCFQNTKLMVSSLLAKADLLNLRDLTLEGFFLSDILPILPIIFAINPLRCLKLDFNSSQDIQELNFPSEINLTCLRSLFIGLRDTDLAGLNPFISKLSSLEDLHLYISGMPRLSLSSQTIRKLELIVTDYANKRKLDIVDLSLPSLELLVLHISDRFGNLSHIDANFPSLRKADICLRDIHERNVSIVGGLLNCIAHVEELRLELIDNEDYPLPILWESGKDVPIFSNLKHLDVTLCYHKKNFEAVTRMLHNCPVLKSLNLYHKTLFERGRKVWQSKLPRNSDGNYSHACFRNLDLEEEQKKFKKLLSKNYSFKSQARN